MSQPRVVRFDVYDVASDCSQFFSAHRRHRHDPREAQHLCWSELQQAEIAAVGVSVMSGERVAGSACGGEELSALG